MHACILLYPHTQNVAVNRVSDMSPRLNMERELSKPTAVFSLQKPQPTFIQSIYVNSCSSLWDDSNPKNPSELLLLHVLLLQRKTKNHNWCETEVGLDKRIRNLFFNLLSSWLMVSFIPKTNLLPVKKDSYWKLEGYNEYFFSHVNYYNMK